ncbi:uncharacterized protein CDAR_106451 [Caerostris darwini]|uniref:Methyltransferase type 11 domain-containing protein n=1 Tax=Caerostris darwini TaxID=1538125 RepID=A0AAV4S8X1_9ARAC|nr:uncharacterized protein CDAR_106451 [Caerostris darwini]
MDVGCGNPKVKFSDLLMEFFPNVKQIIPVDKKSALIDYVKCSVNHPKICYESADIEDWSTLQKWEGKISKVVSSHCFHQLKDQKIAFQNIFRMLKPGGEVAVLLCLKSGYVAWHCDMVNNSEWNRYYNGNSPEIPLTQFSNKEASEYENFLKEIGFSIIECKKDRIGVPFESTEIWKNAIFNLALSSFAIPENSKERFKEDICKTFINHNAMLADKPCTISYFLTVLLRKPVI